MLIPVRNRGEPAADRGKHDDALENYNNVAGADCNNRLRAGRLRRQLGHADAERERPPFRELLLDAVEPVTAPFTPTGASAAHNYDHVPAERNSR